MSKDAAVRDEATRPVLNVVEAFRAGVTPRALNMELFATFPIASELYLVVVYFAPMEHGWRRRQRRNAEPIACQAEPRFEFRSIKVSWSPAWHWNLFPKAQGYCCFELKLCSTSSLLLQL